MRAKVDRERAEWLALQRGLQQVICSSLSQGKERGLRVDDPLVESAADSSVETAAALWRLSHRPPHARLPRGFVRGFDARSVEPLLGMPQPHRPRSGRPPIAPSSNPDSPAARALAPLAGHLQANMGAGATQSAADELSASVSLPLLRTAHAGWRAPRPRTPPLPPADAAPRGSAPPGREPGGARSRPELPAVRQLRGQLSRAGTNLRTKHPLSRPGDPEAGRGSRSISPRSPSTSPRACVLAELGVTATGESAPARPAEAAAAPGGGAGDALAGVARLASKAAISDEISQLEAELAPGDGVAAAASALPTAWGDDSGADAARVGDTARGGSEGAGHTPGGDRRGTVIGGGSSEAAQLAVLEKLRAVLAKHATRVVDIFEQWDEDGNGVITKAEFRRGLRGLLPQWGVQASRGDLDRLFDSLDGDGSGEIEYAEIKTLMRVERETAEKRKRGGASRHALRQGLGRQQSTSLQLGAGAGGGGGSVFVEELRRALHVNAAKVMDLFRSWDVNGDGIVTRGEFRRALDQIGLHAFSAAEKDELFDEFDGDGDGWITIVELSHALRGGADSALPARLRPGGAGPIATRARNRTALRSTAEESEELAELQRRLAEYDLKRGARPSALNLAKLRAQLRGHEMGLDSQLTPEPSEAGHGGPPFAAGSSVTSFGPAYELYAADTQRMLNRRLQAAREHLAASVAQLQHQQSASRLDNASPPLPSARRPRTKLAGARSAASFFPSAARSAARAASRPNDARVQPLGRFFPTRDATTFVEVDVDEM